MWQQPHTCTRQCRCVRADHWSWPTLSSRVDAGEMCWATSMCNSLLSTSGHLTHAADHLPVLARMRMLPHSHLVMPVVTGDARPTCTPAAHPRPCAAYCSIYPAGCCAAQQRARRHPHPVLQEPLGQAFTTGHSTKPARPVCAHKPRGISQHAGTGPVQCNPCEPRWHDRPCPAHRVPHGNAQRGPPGCGSNSGSHGSSGCCSNTGHGGQHAIVWACWHHAAVSQHLLLEQGLLN